MDKLTFDWNNDNQSDHVGFFVSMKDARRVNTIEWNTSRRGDGKEIGVWERVRFVSDIQGFIRSPYRDDEGSPDARSRVSMEITVDSFDGSLGPNTARGLQRFYAAQKRVPQSAIDGSLEGPSLTVTEVQRDLIRIKLLPAGADDGFLGPQTKTALMKRFGVKTWKAAVRTGSSSCGPAASCAEWRAAPVTARRYTSLRTSRPGGRVGSLLPPRNVRAPKSRVVANGHPG